MAQVVETRATEAIADYLSAAQPFRPEVWRRLPVASRKVALQELSDVVSENFGLAPTPLQNNRQRGGVYIKKTDRIGIHPVVTKAQTRLSPGDAAYLVLHENRHRQQYRCLTLPCSTIDKTYSRGWNGLLLYRIAIPASCIAAAALVPLVGVYAAAALAGGLAVRRLGIGIYRSDPMERDANAFAHKVATGAGLRGRNRLHREACLWFSR